MNDIDRKFMQFHANNPHVYSEIKKYADQVWSGGHRQFGMGAIFERIRWDSTFGTNPNTAFKINNNFRSRYVKLLEKDYPKIKGFFRVRELNASSLFAIDYPINPQKHLWP